MCLQPLDILQAPEGVFCPSAFDQRTGRFEYENSITGDTLTFQSSGAWCVGSACSVPLGGADPIGVSMPGFEAGQLLWISNAHLPMSPQRSQGIEEPEMWGQ